MMRFARLPIRYRLSVMFAASAAIVIAGLSTFVYAQTASGLLATLDANLRTRADPLAADVRDDTLAQVSVRAALAGNAMVFTQIYGASGAVLRSTPRIAGSRLLSPAQVRSLRRPARYERKVAGIGDVTRVLAIPVVTRHGVVAVAVGASLGSRHQQLIRLAATLVIAGSAALLLISAGAWLALAGALRPVERMRRQAADISAADPGRRLSVADGRDEIALLGATLNQMLDRIEQSVDNERRLVDSASHELRTPLAIQRIGLDVALEGPQTAEELGAALRGISEDNAHLTRLTEDLLVFSRARQGELPIRRADSSLRNLLEAARRRLDTLAGTGRLRARISFTAPDRAVRVDPAWFRQAIDNLVSNALAHTPPDGSIDVRADLTGASIRLVVEDTGPGFPPGFAGRAFEPFTRAGPSPADGPGGAGLGLAVVDAIARAHGGRAWAQNRPGGGARVTVLLRSGDQPAQMSPTVKPAGNGSVGSTT
jgi:two-component system, OmpR family, sensor kinase